ncbi:alginate O-acetyltransferase AlgX-related protein [Hymenobacter sp. CRA2]|uniref:alginate O-acetyltransferase AlgX-related protein n=1 Tax=Hymenobacter sp. CRA2 TaxID=1955620 RepID=UPI00098E96C7|nr:hypothetical protein [Hymenobacter sp. CRA2]OON70782.1 hypothetical protein B0919_01865 [Hymenobacter sp. CRA2]
MSFSIPLLIKRLLFGVLLIGLMLPALQTQFQLLDPPEELGGYAEAAPKPEFNWPSLLDNSFQPAFERYMEEQIGFREVLIRLRNQVAYSVFRVSKANKVLVGGDDVLFDETAIRAYLGQDFKGLDNIRPNVRRFKVVQDTLARHGVLLVFAIAPDKANFYPEHFPAYFQQLPRSQSNYQAYAQEMKARGVNVIDLAAAFQQWKDTASYPLFPRGGIHWSGYGITLAADTLFHYIEQRGHLDLADFRSTGREVVDETHDTDNDVAKAMNLLVPPAPFRMAYPHIAFDPPKPGQVKPNLLVVGDSFNWGLIGFYPFYTTLFDKFQFWYYNQEIAYGNSLTRPGQTQVSQLDRKAELLAQRVILVLFTQHNLGGFDGNFSADMYSLLSPYSPAAEARIKDIEQELQRSPAVQDSLWQRANRTKTDYGGLLHAEAVQQYELQQL